MVNSGQSPAGQTPELDAIVLGNGPAGLAIAAALCDQGLTVAGLSPTAPTDPWPNTYGIWVDELEALGLTALLEHRWDNCVSYLPDRLNHNRSYGLFDKTKLQNYWRDRSPTVIWHRGKATALEHHTTHSIVHTDHPEQPNLRARIVIDASGHHSPLLQRPPATIAYQAAYGIVGKFSAPVVESGQFVMMDYRADHLSAAERHQPPTFSYEMDLGHGVYFVEETSLAATPALEFEVLEKRLQRRLAHRGIQVNEIHHVEHCLFPMNTPLPDFNQPVLGFGGTASMVHPASGFMVGGLLRRAPGLAAAIAQSLQNPQASPTQIAQAGWQVLWSRDRLRTHYLYLFGMEALMGFERDRLNHHFSTFFQLPPADWRGFLADTLSTPELIRAMLGMFAVAPNDVRWGLMRSVLPHGQWLKSALLA